MLRSRGNAYVDGGALLILANHVATYPYRIGSSARLVAFALALS